MNPNKLLQEKRQFIHWFLETQTLKNPQAARVLYTLLKNDSLLIQVKFVTDISGFQNAILISAEGTNAQPFVCKIGGIYYHLVEEAINALNSVTSEAMHICLTFKKCFPCTCPDLIINPHQQSNEDFLEIVEQEMQLYFWQKELKKQELRYAIDRTLENGDKTEFLRLTEKLKSL